MILLIFAGILFFGILTAFSSGMIQVKPVDLIFSFHGHEKKVSEEYKAFEYNDHVYVPIRFISDNLNLAIAYHSDERKISVGGPDEQTLLSANSAGIDSGSWNLSIHSDKKQYHENEPMHVWAELRNTGNESAEIIGCEPLLAFMIEDADQAASGEIIYTIAKPYHFGANDQMQRPMPVSLIPTYKYEKKTGEYPLSEVEYNRFINSDPHPFMLPKGTYTISVSVEDGTDSLDSVLRSSIDISVQ